MAAWQSVSTISRIIVIFFYAILGSSTDFQIAFFEKLLFLKLILICEREREREIRNCVPFPVVLSRGISLLLHHRPFFNIFDAGERRIPLLLLTKCDRSMRFSFLPSSLALGTRPPHCIEGLFKGLGLGLRV
jgi:hypothetical protein